jgi:hypothetical protein
VVQVLLGEHDILGASSTIDQVPCGSLVSGLDSMALADGKLRKTLRKQALAHLRSQGGGILHYVNPSLQRHLHATRMDVWFWKVRAIVIHSSARQHWSCQKEAARPSMISPKCRPRHA